MSAIILRTVTMYIILVITMRFMGKRQIGEMQLSELVVTLMLSEIAFETRIANALENINISIGKSNFEIR